MLLMLLSAQKSCTKRESLNIWMLFLFFMETSKVIFLGMYAIIMLYILYRIFLKRNPNQEEYERLYNEILTSRKYKVKGQFDRDD